MQRAYFESRLYDEQYWKRYFDMFAANRFNSFVLIFGYENGGFMAPMYPYFFDVPEFPGVELAGITKEQQARNTAAFKSLIRTAHDRGIEVTADNLAAYTKAALRRFLQVFPEVDAVQFRMNDESWLSAKISTKYWMEQMGMPFHPTHINVQNQHDRRHGYADLLRYPQRYGVRWQLWSGGATRVLLWGDPDYVRRFATSVRLYDGDSFDVNEMLATWMLGEPHDEKPLNVISPLYKYYDYGFERYWQFYRLWGRLTYNPETSPEIWEHEFARRFGPEAGGHVMHGLQLASQVLPRIVAASYRYQNFPTTRGWAEMNRQGRRDLGRTSIGRGTNEEAIHSFIMQVPEEDILTLIECVPDALVKACLYEPKGWDCSIAGWALPELLEDALDRLNKFSESVSCEARFGLDGTFCRCPAERVAEALSLY